MAYLYPAPDPRGGLVLGHGAGGSLDAPDLAAVTDAALAGGFSVALVLQPYRVAGKRSSPVPAKLDDAWTAVVGELRSGALAGLPLVTGGRSAGAHVACRTAAATGAAGVLCLAFPLRPPPRAGKPPGQPGCRSWRRSRCRCWWCRAKATASGCPSRRPAARWSG